MARSKDISGVWDAVPCTPSSSDFAECRAVIASAAGTVDGVMASGRSVSGFPVVAGANPYQMTRITAATATIWLGY